MSAMFLAMVWHARRHRSAARALASRCASGPELVAGRSASSTTCPMRCGRRSRSPAATSRSSDRSSDDDRTRGLGGDRRAVAHGADRRAGCCCCARAGQADFATTAEEVDARYADRGRRDALGGGRAAGMAGGRPRRAGRSARTRTRSGSRSTRWWRTPWPTPRQADAIELRTRAVGGQVAIDVADEGCGIPPEVLDRIFERFGARPTPARGRSRGGVGLGLAIVDAIAKAHGGRCTVRSSPSGSTFTFDVPGFQRSSSAQWPRPRATASPRRPELSASPNDGDHRGSLGLYTRRASLALRERLELAGRPSGELLASLADRPPT